jgi:hypothetical protein
MGKPYSMDLRERVVAAIEGGIDAPGGRRGLRSELRQPQPGRGSKQWGLGRLLRWAETF